MLGLALKLFKNSHYGSCFLLGLRNETEKLRFVTFAIATISFAQYNQLIRVDADKEQTHG